MSSKERIFRREFRALILFAHSKKANVAMIFALSLVPICLAAGAGLDLTRAMVVRERLTEALDAASLAVGSTPGATLSEKQATAQAYFNANYVADESFGTPAAVNLDMHGQEITLSTQVAMPTTLMNLAGLDALQVHASSTVVWGQTKLWVSLVLDNTGSMLESDRSRLSKLDALKSATHQLLDLLKGASANAGDVKVSIVPFNRDVNVGGSNYDAGWLNWDDWDSVNTTSYTDCSSGYGHGHGGHNHCTTVTQPASHTTWNGCVTDRDQSYDTRNTAPVGAATAFPADQYASCPVKIQPLTSSWSTLSDVVDSMSAAGNTNQTIGLAWGWQSLTDGAPLDAGSLPSDTSRVIILLSDGLNTENRWSSTQSKIDAREKLACDNAKADGIIIYTVFVDLNGTSGDSAALQYCASTPDKYFDLTRSSEISNAFATIGTEITNLRISK